MTTINFTGLNIISCNLIINNWQVERFILNFIITDNLRTMNEFCALVALTMD